MFFSFMMAHFIYKFNFNLLSIEQLNKTTLNNVLPYL